MIQQHHQQKWSRLIALFLVGAVSQSLVSVSVPERSLAQTPTATPNACAQITAPLTPEEQTYAKAAWQYLTGQLTSVAEIYSYFGGVMFLIGLWRPIVRRVKSLNQLTPPLPRSEWPTVDVFITCYNEPVEIVEETTKAALAIDYPATKLCVYVLDDGNSPALRAMKERLGLEDLQSPLLQQEAERINRERSQLVTRLQQIENLAPEIPKAEQFLQSFQLQVHTEPKDLSRVFSWFDQLRQPSIPTNVWLECQTALAEGFDNAVRHAHKGLPSETPIEIEVTIFTQSLEIRIWDRGLEFDFEGYLQQLPDEVDEMAEGGRGLGIMQKIADHLSYTRSPDCHRCFYCLPYHLFLHRDYSSAFLWA